MNSLLAFFFFCRLIGSRRDNLKAATTLGVLDKDKRFDIRLIDQSRLIQKYLAPRPRGIKEMNDLVIPEAQCDFFWFVSITASKPSMISL